MTNQVIPAEAVEAAALVLYERDKGLMRHGGPTTLLDRRAYMEEAYLVLEAAAPHLLAGLLSGHINSGPIEGYEGVRCECGRWSDSDADYIAHLLDARPTP